MGRMGTEFGAWEEVLERVSLLKHTYIHTERIGGGGEEERGGNKRKKKEKRLAKVRGIGHYGV